MDNLRKQHVIVLDWYFMWKKGGEHLLSRCVFASALWLLVFSLFGIQWVMPSGVTGLLACWKSHFDRHCSVGIWNAIPHCLMWFMWKERHAWCYEGHESSVSEVKYTFLRSLYEWLSTSGQLSFNNFFEMIGLCNFRQ